MGKRTTNDPQEMDRRRRPPPGGQLAPGVCSSTTEAPGRMRRDPVFDSRIGPRSHFGPASISNLAKDVSVSFLGKYGASLSW